MEHSIRSEILVYRMFHASWAYLPIGRYLHLIQVSLALVNTLLLQEVLAEDKWKQAMKQEGWCGLTPLF